MNDYVEKNKHVVSLENEYNKEMNNLRSENKVLSLYISQ